MIVEELYDALIEAGASAEKARAASRAVADMERHFANIEKDIFGLTHEISGFRSYVEKEIFGLKQEISELRSHVEKEIFGLKQEISQLRSYVDQGFTEIRGTLRLHNWMLGTILAFLVAVFFKVFSL